MSTANELEMLMLDLINQERATANVAPLSFNGDLNEASEDHSQWMLDTNNFSHTGENGSSAGDRIVDAGYKLEGNWTWGENIGWQSERGDPGLEDDVRQVHESLMNSPGHRANILSPDFEEIGIGIEGGDFQRFDSVMVTQNFGTTDAVPSPQPPANDDTPIADGPTDDMPDDDTPVADGPTDDTPDDDTPVADGPTDDTPDDDTPVADGPTDDTPDDDTPVADGPTDDTPDDDTPVADDPVDHGFDTEAFLAQLNDMLENLFDSFNFVAFRGNCDDGMDDIPMDMADQMDVTHPQDDMVTDSGGWGADQIVFNIFPDMCCTDDIA